MCQFKQDDGNCVVDKKPCPLTEHQKWCEDRTRLLLHKITTVIEAIGGQNAKDALPRNQKRDVSSLRETTVSIPSLKRVI